MRKLVTVRKIDEILPIDGADAIVCAKVGGWAVVVKKDEFQAGDLCVVFEIDSFLPETDYRFQFLMPRKITWNGHHGARLRTVKIRGQVSQGLVLPIKDFPEVMQEFNGEIQEQDFSELLNVLKWEPVINAQLAGMVRGNFPSQVHKTDQERAQNIVGKIFDDLDRVYEVSIKLEGSSMTVANIDGDIHVCSRNMSLKLEDEGNAFVKTANESGAIDLINRHPNLAFQGELVGRGIQGNIESFADMRFYIFDIFDIKEGKYLLPSDRHNLLKQNNLNHVPIVTFSSLRDLNIFNIEDLITYADGPSINAKLREGLVFKSMDSDFSFKIISNKYLLKEK